MNLKRRGGRMKAWRNPLLLLSGIGVSYLGNWIYLIALNLSILKLTGSAAAVAGLYVIRPIAILITNTWSGSVIDRINKRRLMVFIDVVRGVLVAVIPFISSLWVIYVLLLLINMAGAFFGPSASVYITKLVPPENRKRFNSIMSMTSSGAFLLGPAVAGVLIMKVGTDLCIIINAISFLVCAFFIYLLPNVDESSQEARDRITWKMLMSDWRIVRDFSKKAKAFISIYILFQTAMLIGFALDSQEVTFIKQHLQLSDGDYGLITSLTGAGTLLGGFIAILAARKISLRFYLGVGMLFTSVGYAAFYASSTFLIATLSFMFLGFFMSFANSGYATFFQNNVPVEIMGRFGSVADMLQAVIQIGFTLLLGALIEGISLQMVCFLFAGVGVIVSIILIVSIFMPAKSVYFRETVNISNS